MNNEDLDLSIRLNDLLNKLDSDNSQRRKKAAQDFASLGGEEKLNELMSNPEIANYHQVNGTPGGWQGLGDLWEGVGIMAAGMGAGAYLGGSTLAGGAAGAAAGGGLTAEAGGGALTAEQMAAPALSGAGGSGIGLSEATLGTGAASGLAGVTNNSGGTTSGNTTNSSGTTNGDFNWGDFASNNAGQIVGGLAGLYNANQQGQAAEDAANQYRADMEPWRTAGVGALDTMQTGLQPGGQFVKNYGVSDYEQDPYNKWLQEQGNQGIMRNASKTGMLGSGNLLAELSKYNQGVASQGYADQYNRFTSDQTNDWNRLAGLSGTGQTTAQGIGENNMYGIQGQADANTGTTNTLANMFNNIYNNPQNWNKNQTSNV